MTVNLGNLDNVYTAPMGDVSVNGEGGTDTLVLNYSTVTAPIVYWNSYGWGYFSDEAMNTIEFYGFEKYDITGGSESDDLRGGDNADRFVGGAGNDTIYSGLGADVIDGGAGAKDRWVVDYTSLAPADISISLLAAGSSYTIATSGASVKNIEALTVDTGAGNDVINTSAVVGNDDIETRDGDDIITPGLGFDRVDPGAGIDTLVLNYSTLTADIRNIDYGYGWFRFQDGLNPTTAIDYYRSGFEAFNITGGSGNDNLAGRSDYDSTDRLVGNAGNDTLYGYGGVDTINGGAGTDTWVVDYDEVNANVVININNATQSTSTGATLSGIEQLIADTYQGDDNIVCKADRNNDNIETRGGADTITAGLGKDYVNAGGYGEGNNLVLNWSTTTTNVTWTDQGYSWYRFSSGEGDQIDCYAIDNFNVSSGSGNDYLRSFGGFDTLKGGAGDDTLSSGTGKAVIDGGAGTDYWEADVSAILTGVVFNAVTSQTTSQSTGAGHDIRNIEGLRLTTGNGNDNLNTQGFATSDNVSTNDGADTIASGLGNDTLNAGAGTDLLVLDYSSLTSGIDRTDLGYGWFRYSDALGSAKIDFYGFEKYNLIGGSEGDHLYGGTDVDTLVGKAGDDVLNSYSGKDTINGGDGNDTWIGDYSALTGAITLTLPGTGTALLKLNGTNYTSLTAIENVQLNTGVNADTINLLARAGNHVINTNGGNDAVKLGAGIHTVNGGANTDLLVVNFSTSTTSIRQVDQGYGWYKLADTAGINSVTHYGFEQFDVTGGSGNDRLFAWDGDDKLSGGAGADVLNGGNGADILTGGAGNDIFVYASYNNGNDTITDAAAGDIIRVNGRSFSSSITVGDGTGVLADQIQLSVDNVAKTTTLFVGSDGTAGADVVITLQGVYNASGFSLSGRDILLTAGITNTPTVGNDTVVGTAGNDELYGGDGNDSLQGKGGDDQLFGDAGADTLIGGLGADILTGGIGADRFQFTNKLDSTPGTLYHDVIMDFVSGTDKIDLSQIDANPVVAGDQAFKFITTEFTGVAGQIRYSGGLILGDINGDGMTDIEIMLDGAPTLLGSDFVL